VSVAFSSHTSSSSSSESLRMIILPSLGGPRKPRLRSPKKLYDELLILRDISDEISLIKRRRKIHH
jgi:hypothetical protein